mmetsp:Transcript_96498/g.211009  ORF Transcript_96498/g.211009 Transcript_96498/m.211009 type:complete len:126 (-) Transcript_96498:60-437(-)
MAFEGRLVKIASVVADAAGHQCGRAAATVPRAQGLAIVNHLNITPSFLNHHKELKPGCQIEAAKRAYRRLALQRPLNFSPDLPEVQAVLRSERKAMEAAATARRRTQPEIRKALAPVEVRVIRVE